MKKVIIATIFFCISSCIFFSQLQAQQAKRIKLLSADLVLLNGDSVSIATLENSLQQEIKQQIEVTCKRNLQIALAAQKSQPAKSFYFLKNSLLLDSTYLSAHAALINLYLDKNDEVNALAAALNAYSQTALSKLIPIIAELKRRNGELAAVLEMDEIAEVSTDTKLNYIKGLTYYQQQNYDSAALAFEKSINYPYASLGRGTTQLLHTNQLQGQAQLQALLADSLSKNLAAYHLAISAYQNNDFEKALSYLDEAFLADSTLTYALYMRAHLNYLTGNLDKALADFTACLVHNYRYNESLVNVAVCQNDLAMFEEAEKTASQAIERFPEIAVAYLIRGNAKEIKHDFGAACEDWYKAVDLGMTDILPLITNFCRANSAVK